MRNNAIARREFLAAAGSAAAFGLVTAADSPAADSPTAATPGLDVGPVRRVSAEGVKHFEPWIAANPRDASNLVVLGSRYLSGPGPLVTEPAAWFTSDGGATWSAAEFVARAELAGPRSGFGNAHVAFAADGTAFCVYTGSPSGRELDLWVFRSEDGGRRWHGPTRLAGMLDFPRIAVDHDPVMPRIYLAAGVEGDSPVFGKRVRTGYGCVVLRSDDRGRTFSVVNFIAPTMLRHDPIDSPLVLPDGRFLVGITDYPAAETVHEPEQAIEHVRVYAVSSKDHGETFSKPAPVGEGLRWDGYKALAVDRSDGPRRGRIYAVSHSQTANPPGLRVQTSDDGGRWSAPAAVPGLPPGPVAYATVAVSSRGVLGLAWIQAEPGDPVRPHHKSWQARSHAWRMYATASADGGATYAPPTPIFPETYRTDPSVPRWPFGAEYVSLAASSDGRFHVAWVDTRDGKGEVRAASIDARG